MRVLLISSLFPRPHARGRGIFCFHQCAAMAQEHTVRVVSPRTWGERMQHGALSEQRPGQEWRLPPIADGAELSVSYPTYFYPPKVMRAAYGWFMWGSLRRHLLEVINDFQPEVVISVWAHPDGEVGLRAARVADVPAMTCVVGSDVLLLMRHAARRRAIVRVLSDSSQVITVSQDLKQKVIQLGIPAEKVHAVPRGLDQAVFYPGDRQAARRRLQLPAAGKIALFVGNLVPVKGLDVLLKAFARLNDPHVNLFLVGAGPLRDSLAQLCATLKISERVHFKGQVPQTDLPDWYRAADVTVLASHSEGIPNVARESQACHTPIVATNVGGIPEVAISGMSRLVPAGDAAALATAIAATLNQDRATLPPAPQFESWEQSARRLMVLAEEVRATYLAEGVKS